MTYQQLWHQLTPLYVAEEAQAVTRLVLEKTLGLSLTDIVCGKVSELSADDETKLREIWRRLEGGEPVQYVLGEADFFGRTFHVARGVLIPRPETEGLCRLALEGLPECARLLDIGTGSGCIAVTLALEAHKAQVEAWDISPEALRQATDNARRLGASVLFRQRDVLVEAHETQREQTRKEDTSDDKQKTTTEEAAGNNKQKDAADAATSNNQQKGTADETSLFDCIVSNPPYIADKERAAMASNVLDHEPHLALFVPDDDPLRFYRAIALIGLQRLRPGGRLCFEINPLYASALCQLLRSLGYDHVKVLDDDYGKKRYAIATQS